jgi:dTDP-3-amino-3,4,6-trideoxy-alpha-D-glucose transaminase
VLPFADLHPGDDGPAVRAAIERVVASGRFILGPEVERFEVEFAAACGGRFAVGVACGTDAIALALKALGIGPGDEVIVPAMTAAFTGLAVAAIGAIPTIVDVEPATLNIDPSACAAAITRRTRAIVPVHLYGQPADMEGVRGVADRHGLAVVEDCCQAHLATAHGIPVGTRSQAGAFSFYPTKNLATLGDGGAVLTNDAGLADRVRRLRNGGQIDRYLHAEAGWNSRLDELHAAVLRVRLPRLAEATQHRRALAALYRRRLAPGIVPIAEKDPGHVYHLFATRSDRRDELMAYLAARGIGTLIHYPVPLSAQPAFASYAPAPCPVAAAAAGELVSLPLHPRLSAEDVTRVSRDVNVFLKGRADE